MRSEVLALAITASALSPPRCESDTGPASPRGWFELRPVAAESYFDRHESGEIYYYEDHNYYDDHYREVSAPV